VEARPREIRILDEEWFEKWMNKLERSDFRAHGQILVRLDRVEEGNLGDHAPVGEGVVELRSIKTGPGFCIYIGQEADTVIILYAGTKATQTADIKIAKKLWKDYKNG
jgi:putative addiction module killer protein